MKTKLFLTLALLLLPLTPAFSQFAQPPPQISVSGSAEIKVAPDEIRISVGVETRDTDLNTAKSQHDERMANALKFLKTSGVPDKDVQTDFISVAPEYDNDRSRIKPVVYIVRKSIEIKLTTITNLEPILTGLLNNGVNHVHNVNFRTTQLRKYRDQARAMAIRAAKEKANALCNELGVKCGKPSNISANEWGGWSGSSRTHWGGREDGYGFNNASQNVVQNEGGPSDSVGDTLSVGQISVSASVNVTFIIQ
jgi:uncharacterized protein YggE